MSMISGYDESFWIEQSILINEQIEEQVSKFSLCRPKSTSMKIRINIAEEHAPIIQNNIYDFVIDEEGNSKKMKVLDIVSIDFLSPLVIEMAIIVEECVENNEPKGGKLIEFSSYKKEY